MLNQQIFKLGFGKLCTSTHPTAGLAHRVLPHRLALGRHVAGVLWKKSFMVKKLFFWDAVYDRAFYRAMLDCDACGTCIELKRSEFCCENCSSCERPAVEDCEKTILVRTSARRVACDACIVRGVILTYGWTPSGLA